MDDLMRVLLLSFAMGLLVYFSIPIIEGNLLKLIIGISEGVLFYLSIAWFLDIGESKYLLRLIRKK
jgi:hypothetical protein